MRVITLSVLFLAASIAHAGDGPLKPKLKERELSPLEKALTQLQNELAEARGLKFKSPVDVKVIPRLGGDRSQAGFYDINTRTMFVFSDVKDTIDKMQLAREMAHALQDQNFDLSKMWQKLRDEKLGEDAQLALAALIQGDATVAVIELMKKDNPKLAAVLDESLEGAKDLHRAFLYGQSARFVKAIKDRGGWSAVNMLFVHPPRSTAPFFNLRNVATVRLGPGAPGGAFALWKKLNELEPSRDAALKLATAWRGDRTIEIPLGKAFVYAMSDAASAKLLVETLGKLVSKTPDIVFDIRHQLHQDENRVYLLSAVGEKGLALLRDRLFGPLHLQVYSARAERLINYSDFIDELLGVDIICIGELHDHDLHHRVQLQIIKSLYARDDRLGVGFEMFQLPFQKTLDEFVDGKMDEAEFLKASQWASRWGFDWSMYKPIVEFARKNRLPMAALNAPRELTSKISKGGWDSLTAAEAEQLGPVDLFVKEHRDWWYDRLSEMHGDPTASPERRERAYQVMATWDDVMGRSAATFLKERRLRRLVVLAGLGHIEHGFGIPARAARLHGARVATVGILVNPPDFPSSPTGRILLGDRPMTDFVVIVRD